jgi:hypothetical protein
MKGGEEEEEQELTKKKNPSGFTRAVLFSV